MTGEKILFVDDEKNVRILVEISLSQAGYHVTTVAGGKEALALVRERTFDVMLTDLRMPGMSGEELLEQVRTVTADLEVIVVTAYPGLANAVRTIRAGISDYVLKPFHLNQLELAIRRCLERKHLRAALQHEQYLQQQSEELSRMKSELLATLFHELHTPLSTIMDYTDQLRANDLHRNDEETKFDLERHGLEQIAQSAAQILEIVQRSLS